MFKRIIFFIFLFPNFNIMAQSFDGSHLSLWWSLPFVFIILSIALGPTLVPKVWHSNYGKIIFFITLMFLIILSLNYNLNLAYDITIHSLIKEYIPFIVLLFSLYTVSGGILITGSLKADPKSNTIMLFAGAILSSLMGTTGSTMLMIRPLIKANSHRKYKTHIFIFVIILIANIGGGLTPIGDPPLFLGFLQGVTFYWTFIHMLLPVLFNEIILLLIFYLVDNYYYRKENILSDNIVSNEVKHKISFYGTYNFLLVILIICSVVFFGLWKTQKSVQILGVATNLSDFLRDIILFIIALISLYFTPKQIRSINEFNWDPIKEVAKLFLGIFITIVPVLLILKAGENGSLSKLILSLHDSDGKPLDYLYFWFCGILSSFLDNAPTYLVFFNVANGDAQYMMENMANTLLAISMGAVFLGSITYVGNAPNFMVKSIVEHNNIKMPGFFGYMKWTLIILVPLFILDTLIFLF